MIIMWRGFWRANHNGHHLRGLDRNHLVLILQNTVDSKKFLAIDDQPVSLIQVRMDNHIRNPGFILQTEKHEALGRSGALPGDHASGHASLYSIRDSMEIAGALHLQRVQPSAAVAHRVRTGGHARAVEVRDQPFFVGHLLQRRRVGLLRNRSEEHTSELQSRGHLVCRLLLEKKKKTQKSIDDSTKKYK